MKNKRCIYETNEQLYYSIDGLEWNRFLGKLDHNTLMLFIFNADAAMYYYDKTGSCDALIGKHLRRIDVTMDYLESNNFKTTYP